MFVVGLAACVAVGGGRDALAGPDDSAAAPSPDRARKAFETALQLYRSGQYKAAVEKLVEARKLDPTAKDLPYNLGLVHEKLGNLDEAIKNFEVFLALEADEGEKERVRAIIKRLEGARSDLVKPPPSAPAASSSAPPPPPPPPTESAPPPPPPPVRKGKLDGLVYGTGGLAAAALLGGVVFGVRALSLRPSESVTGPEQSFQDLQSSARRAHQSAVIADISFGVALVSGGAAALLYFLREAPAAAPASAFVAPVRGGAVVGGGMRF